MREPSSVDDSIHDAPQDSREARQSWAVERTSSCEEGKRRISDLKVREKFSHSDPTPIGRDLSGRTYCIASVHEADALCFVLMGFQPSGNDTFRKSRSAADAAQTTFSTPDSLRVPAHQQVTSTIDGGPTRRNAADHTITSRRPFSQDFVRLGLTLARTDAERA